MCVLAKKKTRGFIKGINTKSEMQAMFQCFNMNFLKRKTRGIRTKTVPFTKKRDIQRWRSQSSQQLYFASSQESKLGEFSSLLSFFNSSARRKIKEKKLNVMKLGKVGVKVSGPCGVYRILQDQFKLAMIITQFWSSIR